MRWSFGEAHRFKGGFPASIYLLKVNNRNIRGRCEICSKSVIKTPERRQAPFTPCSSVSVVNFEHVIAGLVSFYREHM